MPIPMTTPSLRFDESEHRYFFDNLEAVGVTRMIRSMGLDKDWTLIDPKYRIRGKAAHDVCCAIDAEEWDPDSTHPDLLCYGLAYQKFLKDTGFQPVLIEHPVGSFAYRLAGTLDRWGFIGDTKWCIDLKTGEPVHPACDLQVALYAYLLEQQEGKTSDKRMVVHLRKDGDWRAVEPTRPLSMDIADGLAACRLYWLRSRWGLL
jgi:hypothetical protein